jgi:Ca-activated chloride channel family protein
MPQFQYILLLSLLGMVPIMAFLYWRSAKKKQRQIKLIGDPELVNQLLGNYEPKAFLQKFLLLCTAMALLVLAIANLRLATGSEKVSRNGIDVMIAIDVSKSMLAQDVQPTRLDRAKQVLGRLIDKLNNDRVGIVIFAGKSYLQMPLTADHSAAKMYLSAASTEAVPTQGTVIGDALKMCYASFNNKEKKYKAVVLISDGEDHDENAVETAEQMASDGVVINTIGIGSPTGAPIPDQATGQMKTDAEGNTIVSRLNEAALSEIARKGNGTYQLYTNTESVVAKISEELATMDQRNVTDDSLVNYKSFFQWFLLATLIVLLLEQFISEMKKAPRKIKIALATTLLMVSFSTYAQTEKTEIKAGNDAYKKSNFPVAEQSYNNALKKNPANATAQFNLGNALYKADKKEAAIAAYEKSITQLKKPIEKSNAWYNKGVVEQNDQKLPECIASYKEALKLDPANEDARQNLQKALQQQKKEEEKKKEEKKKENEKDNDNQNKQNQQQQEPKPQQSKLTKKEAEEKLKALLQQEKNLQNKLRKVNVQSPNKPEKDW